jgi:hypothetical protein
LSQYHGWDLTDPHGKGVAVLELFTPRNEIADEIETDLTYEGWLGRLGKTVYLGALSVVFGLPVALAAVVLQVLVYAFPIPDILFFGWAVSARLVPQVSIGPDRRRLLDLEFDMEEYFLDAIEHATRSIQGLFLTMFVVLGALVSSISLFVAVGIAPNALETFRLGIEGVLIGAPLDALRPIWNFCGALLLIVFAGSHGLWVWLRELQRLPHFLDRWEDRNSQSGSSPVARVYGFVGASTLAWLMATTFVFLRGPAVSTIIAVAWPIIFVLGLWTVRQTSQRDTVDVTGEHRWIYAGFTVQLVAYRVGVSLDVFVGAALGKRPLAPLLVLPVGVVVMVCLVAAIPTVARYENQYDDIRRFGLVGLLVVLGAVAGFGYLVVPARYELGALALAVVSVASGALLTVVRYFDL